MLFLRNEFPKIFEHLLWWVLLQEWLFYDLTNNSKFKFKTQIWRWWHFGSEFYAWKIFKLIESPASHPIFWVLKMTYDFFTSQTSIQLRIWENNVVKASEKDLDLIFSGVEFLSFCGKGHVASQFICIMWQSRKLQVISSAE